MSFNFPIKIEETAGIDRINEPVSFGIPFQRGVMTENDLEKLNLNDSDNHNLDYQTQILARWTDDSLKWVLFDFQASVTANETKKLYLSDTYITDKKIEKIEIKYSEKQNHIQIDTNAALFLVNKNSFKPFDKVIINEKNVINEALSNVLLTDENDIYYEPCIENIFFETKGPLRCTLKVEGVFKTSGAKIFSSFLSRMSFFVNYSMIKMDFTILNPKAAKHPGGLWDLGDTGSIFFKDLSIQTGLNTENSIDIFWKDQPKKLYNKINGNTFKIYQDSSGGVNWGSPNHVNRNNEVRNKFRGYKVFDNKEFIDEGFRPNPIVSLQDGKNQISGAIQYFWQNFPKAIKINNKILILSLFPSDYDDLFELQGGEQKTHTISLNFDSMNSDKSIEWAHNPIIPVLPAKVYSDSKVFPNFTHEKSELTAGIDKVIDAAVKGENSFFHKREIIDEFGWRHFGDLYADHESVGQKEGELFVSHYNNQYDCIYGALTQFICTGTKEWFILADQLSSHVRDIDIYHTDGDRPEYNHGLFWHTEHYIEAKTATHRCFSKKHADYRDLSFYGGGPSLSHVYSTGLLNHHYLTGDSGSRQAVLELAEFVISNLNMYQTITNKFIIKLRQFIRLLKKRDKDKELVDLNKVYGLDGPGRASGNALSVLLDAYVLTCNKKYLNLAEKIIYQCISPEDDMDERDLLDIENRWMYTVFLQALGKFLDIKFESQQLDPAFEYTRQCLVKYASWMMENEVPYLSRIEELEYPNETWAVQEIRKTNVLLYAAKYSRADNHHNLLKRAENIFKDGVKTFLTFETKNLTRPIALLMQNLMMFTYFKTIEEDFIYLFKKRIKKVKKEKNLFIMINFLKNFSLMNELQFIKWRLKK